MVRETMAAKFKNRLVDQPPSASSSEDEDPSEDEEQQSDPEQQVHSANANKPEEEDEEENNPSTPIHSSNGDESESEGTQPSPCASDFTIKPIVPSEPSPFKQQPMPKKKTGKNGEGEEKRSGGLSGANRLWSEADQLAMLRGMVDYRAQKGADPYSDMSAFHEFIKDKLNAEVSKSQMTEKIRRLRKKFLEKGENPGFTRPFDCMCYEHSKKIWGNPPVVVNGKSNHVESNSKSASEKVKNPSNAKKSSGLKKCVNEEEGEKSKRKSEAKGEENEKKKRKQKTVALGEDKQVAVEEKHEETTVVEKEKPNAVVEKDKQIVVKELSNGGAETSEGDFNAKYPHLVNSFSKKNYPLSSPETLVMLKERLSLIEDSKAKEIEEKWTKLWEEQAKLCGKMASLLGQQMKLVLDTEMKR